MTKIFSLFIVTVLLTFCQDAHAKIWRVNNTAAVNTNFTDLQSAVNSSSVLIGDTIHVEPSATAYAGVTITKRLVFIGNGYLLSGPGSNPGLQENTQKSMVGAITLASGAAGTRFLGLEFVSTYLGFASGFSGNVNITYEKCRSVGAAAFGVFPNSTYSNITFRKCFFTGLDHGTNITNVTFSNFIVENCIITGNNYRFNPSLSSTTGNIFRNNTIKTFFEVQLTGFYVANNIFITGLNNTFTNCNVKNNIFTINQTDVTQGSLSENGKNLVGVSEATIIVSTGSDDGRFQLAALSPAFNGGVDIGGNKPHCGAFGGNDPYKLSGIPGIPTIYSLTVPASIPSSSTTMNVTFSTRNNN